MFLIAPVTSVWGAAMFGEPLTRVTNLGLALTLLAALVASQHGEQEPGERRELATVSRPRAH
jgi:drug/metabolite transporter (DMT)-like permease